MNKQKFLILLCLVLLGLVFYSGEAVATSCIEVSEQEEFDSHQLIFIGDAQKVEESLKIDKDFLLRIYKQEITFKILNIIKGEEKGDTVLVKAESYRSGVVGEAWFMENQRYLVYSKKNETGDYVASLGSCSPTKIYKGKPQIAGLQAAEGQNSKIESWFKNTGLNIAFLGLRLWLWSFPLIVIFLVALFMAILKVLKKINFKNILIYPIFIILNIANLICAILFPGQFYINLISLILILLILTLIVLKIFKRNEIKISGTMITSILLLIVNYSVFTYFHL